MIALLVHMTIKPGTVEECKQHIAGVTAGTRKEPGCVQYTAHQSQENPLHFIFYEVYQDMAALETHWASPHFAQYVTGGIDALVAARTKELFDPVC